MSNEVYYNADDSRTFNYVESLFRLYNSKTTEEGCYYLASALMTNPSHLRELDLGGNKLRDSGINHLSAALKEPQCHLETLR